MATFPALQPATRTFTPGRHPHSEIPTLSGLQTRVRTSNVLLDQRLRLTFTALTEAEMLSIRTHYLGQQGRFLSFVIPNELLSGTTTPSSFTPTGYSWIYASRPTVTDIGLQRYDVSVELATVPPEGANINGSEFTVNTSFVGGTYSVSAGASGAVLTVTSGFVGGIVADNESAGLNQTVTQTLAGGTATGLAAGGDPFFSGVIVLLHMDGADESNTITNSAPTGLTVSNSSNQSKIDTAQSKFGGASCRPGGGMQTTSDPLPRYSTNPFTLEAWIYVEEHSTRRQIVRIGTTYPGIYITTAGSLVVENGGTAGNIVITGASVTLNTWHHVALCRGFPGANDHRLYLNGVQTGGTWNSTQTISSANFVYLSQSGFTTNTNKWIDEVRVTKGFCRYTATFTPPTTPFPDTATADPDFSSVSLLLHMNGTAGSTTFTDNSPIAHTLTANGNAQVSTTLPKFGTGSLLLDGTGDDLSIPANTSLAFGSGNFTIEAFIRTTAAPANNAYIFGQRLFGGFDLAILSDLRLTGSTPTLNSATEASTSMALNTWYHVAFTRDTGNVYSLFVDGVLRATTTLPFENATGTGVSYIGQNGLNDRYFTGQIDDLRITKGFCRYTATFTPPTAPFPDS